jgi:hypothetical protein
MNKFIWIRIFLTLIILITALSLDFFYETGPHFAPGQAPLKDIQNIETLRTQFNSDTGKTRLIILVSPT